jgi:hypothetical protein
MAIINKTGITNGGTIQAEHVTRIIDALSGVSTDNIVATGSFTGSYKGDGSQLTGIVSSKWTGSNPISRLGDVNITGSLSVYSNFYTKGIFNTPNQLLYIISDDQLIIQATSSISLQSPVISVASVVSSFDLTNLNANDRNDVGFVLPRIQPTRPTTGSMYVQSDVRKFYVYDGTIWRTGSLV